MAQLAPMPGLAETLPVLEQRLTERLLDFELLDEPWPDGRRDRGGRGLIVFEAERAAATGRFVCNRQQWGRRRPGPPNPVYVCLESGGRFRPLLRLGLAQVDPGLLSVLFHQV